MAVFGNGGTASGAVTCSARTSPRASRRSTSTGASGVTAPKIAAWTSARGITPTRSREAIAHERAQVRGQLGSEVGPVEGDLDVGAEEVELLADVVATVREHAPEDRLLLDEQLDRVGELQLATD